MLIRGARSQLEAIVAPLLLQQRHEGVPIEGVAPDRDEQAARVDVVAVEGVLRDDQIELRGGDHQGLGGHLHPLQDALFKGDRGLFGGFAVGGIDQIAAVQQGPRITEAEAARQLAELQHRHLLLTTYIDATQQGDVDVVSIPGNSCHMGV